MGSNTLEARTIPELLIEAATRWPDRPAVTFPAFTWTYAELLREASDVARGLIGLGVRPRDHVGLLAPNGGDFLRAFFGAALAGAVAVPLNVRYRKADLSYVLGQSDVRALLICAQHRDHFDFEPVVAEILDEGLAPRLEEVVVLGAETSSRFAGERELDGVAAAISHEDVAARSRLPGLRHPGMMLYTSGTTAAPKAAVLSHEAVTRTALAWGREALDMGPEDSVWIPNPLFHVGAVSTLLASVGAGSRFCSMPFFEPDGAVEMLSREEVTLFFPVFDAVALPIIEHPKASGLKFDSLRKAFVIGNPVNVARVKEALPGVRLMNTYGMTETCGWCVLNFDDAGPYDPLGGGRPLLGVEVRIRAVGGSRDAEVDELGLIEVRSWCTLTEYYKDPAATAEAIDDEGWFRTGDLGVPLEDGSFRWRGRSGERMRVGGENVAPMEIEKHLALHPAVRQCAVVGVPDARLGEVPAAFVELFPGSCVAEDEVISHCQGAIARFKVPRFVRFLAADEWPMSTTKIRKSDLRDQLVAELGLADAQTFTGAS